MTDRSTRAVGLHCQCDAVYAMSMWTTEANECDSSEYYNKTGLCECVCILIVTNYIFYYIKVSDDNI